MKHVGGLCSVHIVTQLLYSVHIVTVTMQFKLSSNYMVPIVTPQSKLNHYIDLVDMMLKESNFNGTKNRHNLFNSKS